MNAEERARACAERMWRQDDASRGLGMEITDVAPGSATVRMAVRPDMTNGHRTAHGGFVFSLADSAFAFACNSHDERTVAAHCDITFLTPAHEGETLVATAVERRRFGRNGIYDVTVTCGDRVVAEFRGKSRTIGGPVLTAEND